MCAGVTLALALRSGACAGVWALAVSFGLVGPLTGGNVTFTFLPEFFVSAVGGIFFEEVGAVLNGILSPFSKDKPQSKN